MKLGIAGAGMIVKMFLPEIMCVENITVTGIFARRLEAAQALANAHGIAMATDDFGVLCASGIDTVYVAVSNIAHYEYCKRALETGLHVIVEKPITTNVHQARELEALAKERNLFLFEAITTLHMGTYHQVLQWLPRIGTIRNAQSVFTQRSSRLDAFLSGQVAPAFDPGQAGGCLMDLNVYNIHYIMGIFGKPLDAVYYPNLQNGIDTSGRFVMQYPGFTAHCYGAKDCGGDHGSIIQGTLGYIRTLLPPNQVGKAELHLYDGTREQFDDGSSKTRAAAEFRVFADAIRREDRKFCYHYLEKSITVSEIMTQARLRAGIRFPGE